MWTTVLIIILILATLPLLGTILGFILIKLLGCEVTAARAPDCKRFGFQFGPLLYFLMMLHWLIPVTAPVALIVGVILLLR